MIKNNEQLKARRGRSSRLPNQTENRFWWEAI